jgi:hypothetical protein
MPRCLVYLLLATCCCSATASAAPAVDFRRDIAPLLKERCFRCHQGRDAESGHRLDVKSELLTLVVPGKGGESKLIKAVTGADPKIIMPPEGPRLTAEQIKLLKAWIDAGLPWDREVLPESDDPAQHWAFQPVRRPAVPVVEGDAWSRNPIDRFVLANQREQKLEHAGEAERRTLIRRLYLDLCGVPPTLAEVQAFIEDNRDDAYERLVERLLNSPQYGERSGRLWLDVARWAESEGYESNHPRNFAWRYRDYVTASFNRDQPYDEFIRQQIAGDELPEYSDENVIATGFLAAARISSNEEDKWLQRNDVTVDIVNAVGTSLLGLTLHCAQCHDHKFDPITARDYYALHAFFARGMPVNVRLRDAKLLKEYAAKQSPEYEPAIALKQAMFEAARERMKAAAFEKLSEEERAALNISGEKRTAEQERLARKASLSFQKTPDGIEKFIAEADRPLYAELKKKIAALEKQSPAPPQTFAFYAPSASPHRLSVLPSIGFYPLPYDPQELASLPTYVMPRGDVHKIGAKVVADWPAWLAGSEAKSGPRTRLDLVEWLTSRKHPLVARVWVNRVWQQHFGRGVVATSDDFGLRGAPPTHPELLDWLAAELMDSGWSTKHIQRLIVTSATYRQASNVPVNAADAENRYLSRFSARRLDAETIRDAWLATSGELDVTCGGASVPLAERETSLRRSLYLFQRRGNPAEAMQLFDGPNECAASTTLRTVSTSPLQALYLLNSDFSVARAKALAKEVESTAGSDRAHQITIAFERVLLRPPCAAEQAAAEKLWAAVIDRNPLEVLCQSLLNSNEFNFLE